MKAEAGQFMLWRFLTRRGWWQAHPFSLSAVPDGRRLRFTVKEIGDDTRWMRRVRPGTRVFAARNNVFCVSASATLPSAECATALA